MLLIQCYDHAIYRWFKFFYCNKYYYFRCVNLNQLKKPLSLLITFIALSEQEVLIPVRYIIYYNNACTQTNDYSSIRDFPKKKSMKCGTGSPF